MKDEEIARLLAEIWDSADGSEVDARLSAVLSEHPEIRQQCEAAWAAHRALRSVPRQAMPEDLVREIGQGVRSHRRQPPGRTSIDRLWVGPLRRRPLLGLVPAFAMGVAVGVLILGQLAPQKDGGGRMQIQGTLHPTDELATGRPLDSVEIGGTTIEARRNGGDLLLRSVIHQADAPGIHFSFDREAMSFGSLRWVAGTPGGVEVRSGLVEVTPDGPASFELWLRVMSESPGEIQVTLAGGEGQTMATLRTGP